MFPAKKYAELEDRGAPLAAAAKQLAMLRTVPLDREFPDALQEAALWPLQPTKIDVLQLNVGKLCNQICRHCHVDAGPHRREVMSRQTADECLAVLARSAIPTLDITGGAPELNPNFRHLVEQARALDRHVIDRCNLTIVESPRYRDLPAFFAEQQVELVCSLPHYRPFNTDRQRGEGVFEQSLSALRRFNEAGYGHGDPRHRLVLVFNPVGAFLPPDQRSAEAEWKREMDRLYGIQFDALITITNMPIARYLEWLQGSDNLVPYMNKLVDTFNPTAAAGLMCRNTLSVSWDGFLYDCDFNQALELKVDPSAPQHIRNVDIAALERRPIRVERHCFGCTAGAGSSCGGTTA